MRILVLRDMSLVDSGTIRWVNDEVVLDTKGLNSRLLSEISLHDKIYTSNDGIKYLKALVSKFERSTSIVLKKEPMDTWLEDTE